VVNFCHESKWVNFLKAATHGLGFTLQVKTVDGFQGNEQDIIVISNLASQTVDS
jgi:superfamily I DNA and/or RNA helicase